MEAPAPSVAPTNHSLSREYSIGQLAQECNVTLRALRFYEDRGLLAPRRSGNARFFSSRDRATLAKILKGKQLGFTLSEIKEMLTGDASGPVSDAISLSAFAIDQQISHLQLQRQEITDALNELRTLRTNLIAQAA